MTNTIVLGLGYGDEGKGSVVNKLITDPNSTIVIRFNGGHQAGHTVEQNGYRHVFSSFGAGTLQGVPTYWSKFCTVYPNALCNELDLLVTNGISNIRLHIDPMCPITTWQDVWQNQHTAKHGSVGVGFGKTIERTEKGVTLFAKDLLYPTVTKAKLKAISDHYSLYSHIDDEKFLIACDQFVEDYRINVTATVPQKEHRIFEGAQGILLDQVHGFFPYVTRSNTTSVNALDVIREKNLAGETEIVFVTRSYATRHGIGPFPNESVRISYPDQTNVHNRYQGKLRFAPITLELASYALYTDKIYSKNTIPRSMYVTCLDQTNNLVLTDVGNMTKGQFLSRLNIKEKVL